MKEMLTSLFRNARNASRELVAIEESVINAVLLDLADAIAAAAPSILEANRQDLERMDRSSPLYDRLLLDEKRLTAIADDTALATMAADLYNAGAGRFWTPTGGWQA